MSAALWARRLLKGLFIATATALTVMGCQTPTPRVSGIPNYVIPNYMPAVAPETMTTEEHNLQRGCYADEPSSVCDARLGLPTEQARRGPAPGEAEKPAAVANTDQGTDLYSAFPPDIRSALINVVLGYAPRARPFVEAAIAQCVYEARLTIPANASGTLNPQQMSLMRMCIQAKEAAIQAANAARRLPTLWD